MSLVWHSIKLKPFFNYRISLLHRCFTHNTSENPNAAQNAPHLAASTSPPKASSLPFKYPNNLTPQQKELLDGMLRVNQAGELGANWIYRGQYEVFKKDPQLGPLIHVMHHRLTLVLV
jgi:ubiquinone biosynthesis monooxygenase Coq7